MDKAIIVGKMEDPIKVNIKMIRNMGMEFMFGLMVKDMKVNGH